MVKILLSPITNQKMRNLQEIFTRLRVFGLTLFFGAFNNSQILELLR